MVSYIWNGVLIYIHIFYEHIYFRIGFKTTRHQVLYGLSSCIQLAMNNHAVSVCAYKTFYWISYYTEFKIIIVCIEIFYVYIFDNIIILFVKPLSWNKRSIHIYMFRFFQYLK